MRFSIIELLIKTNFDCSSIIDSIIGYMPQDIALNRDFYIAEILNYFGMLFNMKSSKIEARKAFLINLLDIPKKDKLIKNLRY